MKVISLEITNVRGIKNLLLTPRGQNLVIWGPNGSGKSAVVDAIDFLLTGKMLRLTGAGTGGISLNAHGPHVDHQPGDARVSAILQLPGIDNPVSLERSMSNPGVFSTSAQGEARGKLDAIMDLAGRGQHVLTRREILRFITAEKGNRAKDIQGLLNISEVEEVRRTLVRAQNDLESAATAARSNVTAERGKVASTVQSKTFLEAGVLGVANHNRGILGGKAIAELRASLLKEGLSEPASILKEQTVNVALVERDIQQLRKACTPPVLEAAVRDDAALRDLILSVKADTELLKALSRVELTKLGLRLLDDTGECPLCDTPWDVDELQSHLETKLLSAKEAAETKSKIMSLATNILQSVSSTLESLTKLVTEGKKLFPEVALSPLTTWRESLVLYTDLLRNPLDSYPDDRVQPTQVRTLMAPTQIEEALVQIEEHLTTKFPKATPEQTAWDTLTRLEENVKGLEEAVSRLTLAETIHSRAVTLLSSFQTARDSVLGQLYDTIRDRFVELYRKLHNSDESNFIARLHPDGSGLLFEVDFYGRGVHPPHALHSEGHQDSMGLCLYLALAEHLMANQIDLIILDDVVMSVDADHRRQLCSLLMQEFSNKQFLVTTHDRTWAHQMRYEGVVDKAGSIEFFNWHVDTGPLVNFETDLWPRIEASLAQQDVPGAALRLRRGAEEYFANICDSLRGEVPFRLNGRWELGDFLSAAVGKYKEYLRQAKRASQSWGNQETVKQLQELDSTVGSIVTRTNAEQWAVNANVHYNNWANFTVNDFRPVVEAFYDLFRVFACTECGTLLRVTTTVGHKPSNVTCGCGKVVWNLQEKPN
jgi:energy-coupling factor transporter ATP-binding protein EcfA2